MVFTAEALISNALTSIIILFVKFLAAAMFFPSSMTVIKVRVKSEKVTSETFSLRVAFFEMYEEEVRNIKLKWYDQQSFKTYLCNNSS